MGIDQTAHTTSHQTSQTILEQLEHKNLFLAPLDDLGQWYRYHQLFAEVLQHRLRQSQPELVPILHQRASLWYAQQGHLADAIHHTLLGGDFPRAAALIEEVWSTLWNQGAIATLFAWVQALPDELLVACPSLYVSYAWGLALTGQIAAAEATLSAIETTLQGLVAEETHLLLGRAAALRAMLAARRGEPTAAVQLAHRALLLLPADAASHGEAQYALGLAQQQQGALVAAYQAYERAAQSGIASDDSFLRIAARYHEARILMVQGHLQQAATTYQQILALAAQAKKQLPVVGLAHVGYGEVLYQWNDLAAAAQQVETGLALSPNRDLTYTDGPLHRFNLLAHIRQALNDRQGALAAVTSAKETAQQTGIALDRQRAEALAALIHLRLHEGALAEQWAEQYAQTRPAAARVTYLHEFETLTFARVLLAQGEGAALLTLLAEWVSTIEPTERQGAVLEIDLLQVLALRLTGQTEQAQSLLARTLVSAEPEGYIRLFVDEGDAMRQAITACRASNPQWPASLHRYVTQLLSAFPTAGPSVARQESVSDRSGSPLAREPFDLPANALVEPLTDRELEILRLVAQGLSNAAIATQLVIAVGTVKTHLKRIYGKLAVESRTQAVAQAHALDLL
jgi:LuxR family maltose regulon positive regulatory protein